MTIFHTRELSGQTSDIPSSHNEALDYLSEVFELQPPLSDLERRSIYGLGLHLYPLGHEEEALRYEIVTATDREERRQDPRMVSLRGLQLRFRDYLRSDAPLTDSD